MNRIPIASMKDVKSYFGRHSHIREFVGDYLIAVARSRKAQAGSAEALRFRQQKAKALRDIATTINSMMPYADASGLLEKANSLSLQAA